MDGSIDYGGMLRRALRGMVREALELVAREGLPGEHHFLLSFATAAPGVELPAGLRALHPERMTVVLQHQFWDLEVEADRFAVTLRFGGQQQRIGVPFAALLAFSDPSVGLELGFDDPPAPPRPGGERADEPSGPEGETDGGHRAEVLPFDPARRR
ncbi:MAG: stringent starvation protein B [Thermoanaerobaculia bacterium]|nr:stringent starvation protein B [Thermoanaerobaculia bacterium]MCZ7650902.1 ClpXP protease specificity-enhancing factor SspB [Thermoanaerobaculia bacterium]